MKIGVPTLLISLTSGQGFKISQLGTFPYKLPWKQNGIKFMILTLPGLSIISSEMRTGKQLEEYGYIES
jgi:hypothetical protein